MLTKSDLTTNPVLLRKVKRIQAAEAQENGTYSDEDDVGADDMHPPGTQRRQPEEIGDDDDDDGNARKKGARARSLAPRVKAERLASLAPASTPAVGIGIGMDETGRGFQSGIGYGMGDGARAGLQPVGTQVVASSGAVVVDLGEGMENDDEEEEEED